MNRFVLTAFALLLMSVPAQAQEAAFYDVGGIEYYYALGDPASAHATWGFDRTGEAVADFEGCAWAKLRPDKQMGRISTTSSLQGAPFAVEFVDLFGDPSFNSSIREDTTVRSSTPGGVPEFPEIHATMAAFGSAAIRIDDMEFVDPATGRSTFQASWFVTDEGLRNDDGRLHVGPPDWEMHLRVQSFAHEPRQPAKVDTVRSPDGPLALYMPPDDAHHAVYAFTNERFGGNGTIEVSANSFVPDGLNDLRFTVAAPDGHILSEFALQPGFGSLPEQVVELTLDQFGQYTVEVEGEVNLSWYDITFTQQTPEAFDLDMWWEQIVAGSEGYAAKDDCQALLEGEALGGQIVAPPEPPPFNWLTTLMTIAAGITVSLVGISFVVAVRSSATMLSAVKDR